jgi:hypothetical protein
MYPRGTGCLQVYEMNVGSLSLVAEVEKPSGFKCGTFGASGLEDRHLATGDYSGQLNIWYVVSQRLSLHDTARLCDTKRGSWRYPCPLRAPAQRRAASLYPDFFPRPHMFRCGGGRDLERMDTPLYSVKAHKSIVNNIDGCGGLRIGMCCRWAW